jgi:hypothetical protein
MTSSWLQPFLGLLISHTPLEFPYLILATPYTVAQVDQPGIIKDQILVLVDTSIEEHKVVSDPYQGRLRPDYWLLEG